MPNGKTSKNSLIWFIAFKALLVDVRLYPVSRHRPEWSKAKLQRSFSSYIHVRAYGNESFGTDKPAKLLNPDKAAEELYAWVKVEPIFFFYVPAPITMLVTGISRNRLCRLSP